jgi:TPP-dependent 2-oxoacid decarboxylase
MSGSRQTRTPDVIRRLPLHFKASTCDATLVTVRAVLLYAPHMKIGDYLVHRLHEIGIKRMFSVPGDYTLGLLDHFLPSPIKLVGTCNELGAAYAADGYARVNGVGALCVTYCVGGLSALNGVAGSYAERVPVVVVTGGPSRAQRAQQKMVHHMSGAFDAQLEAFLPVTVGARIIDDPRTAAAQIDELLGLCLHHKRPVYVELPTDVLDEDCGEPSPLQVPPAATDPAALAAVVREARVRLLAAERPVVLSGIEVLRYNLSKEVERFCRRAGLAFGTGLLGKSSVNESAEGYFGVYMGALSRPEVREIVDGSDALFIFGGWLADSSTGGFTHGGDERDAIAANAERVRVGKRIYEPVGLEAFLEVLTDSLPERPGATVSVPSPRVFGTFEYAAETGRRMSMARFMERMQVFLDEKTVLLADTGDSIFWSAELLMPAVGSYVCQGYYLSIGFAIPAALGVALAAPDKRVVVFVGDGAFQMTCQELSTIVRAGLAPIVFVLNNEGYAVERAIHDGPYNEIAPWRYHRITEMLGGRGYDVHTEEQLETALAAARASRELSVIEVHVDRNDVSPTFTRFAGILNRRNVG